jgi:hypothetical protein
MKAPTLSALLLALTTAAGSAQILPAPRVEIRPSIGARFPVGSQRALFKAAPIFGAQGAIEMTPNMHLVGSLGWSPGQIKMNVVDRDVDVIEYDAGIEYNLWVPLDRNWEIKPFAGAGVGARTYLYDSSDLAADTPMTAYGALGTELQRGFAALRIETRGYLHGFMDPLTEDWSSQNELGVAVGFAYHMPRP